MGKFSKLTDVQKGKILALSENTGKSSREISKEVGCCYSTVNRFLKKVKETGETNRKKGSGGVRKTSKSDDRQITRMCYKNRFATAVEMCAEFNSTSDNQIGVHTVRRRLREAGLMARRPAKKPLLTPKMKKQRLEWAKKYQNWTSLDWQQVIFSDESKFNLFGSDGIEYVRRKTGERFNENCIKKTVKHPAGQMIWGCFSYHGIGEIAFIKGYVKAPDYKNILESHLFPSIENHFSMASSMIFQDDSAPCHRAKLVNII